MAGNYIERIKGWGLRHPYWMLTLVTIAALVPFLAKPFNIDDPLFVWAAQQIQSHPGNPYGFNVNWYGTTQPIWIATLNPPLMSYYLALAAGIFGWSEIGLHIAGLLPAVATVLGTYRLAKYFCRWPWQAAVATLFAPGFLVSSTTVMSDVSMLAFWIWAIVFWSEGLRENSQTKLTAAGSLVALAILTKYNGACLIPLLAAYGWLVKREAGRWMLFLLIPVVALCSHEWMTFHLYGSPHFWVSNQSTKSARIIGHIPLLVKFLTTLTFTGGCFIATLFCAPFLWRKKAWLYFCSGSAVLLALFLANGMISQYYSWLEGNARIYAIIEIFLLAAGGLSLLAMTIMDVGQKRDADAWLLALWVGGTFIFVVFVYWMVNGRTLLPIIPAAAILMARRLEKNRTTWPIKMLFPLIASAVIGLLATQADFQQAAVARKSAEQICTKYADIPGKIWFEGHWGFQYYMQVFGASPLDTRQSTVRPGDLLIIPEMNSNTFAPDAEMCTLLDVFTIPVFPGIATMDHMVGAGFYASFFGPLPFAVGSPSPEISSVYRFKPLPEHPKP